MPDPEVRERPLRRRFTAEYNRGIVEEANAASESRAVGALLRREVQHVASKFAQVGFTRSLDHELRGPPKP